MTTRAPTTPPFAGRTLDAAVVAAAVARIEEDGALDDDAVLRHAFGAAGTRAEQVRLRAWLLGERLGLVQELERWRHWGAWVALLLALALALLGLLAGRGVLAPDRSINAVAAFVSLLGLHVLTLIAWFASWAWRQGGAAPRGWSLGRLALALTARLPFDRGRHAPDLWWAFTSLLRRERLWPWLTGALSHAIWTLSLLLTLAVLAFGFAFQAYRLSWETTILSVGFFQHFVAWTGALPALLGVPVPDAAAVRAVGEAGVADPAAQSAWAWWLMGCVALYGVLPRLLLAALSVWRWRTGIARLGAVDMGDPAVQRVVRRLDALEPPPTVIDREQADGGSADPARAPGAAAASGAPLLVGFELPPEQAWPPPGVSDGVPQVASVRIAGTAAEREALLARIAAQRPGALVFAVHAPSSPDRGTARLLREARALAPSVALWPIGNSGTARWQSWVDSEQLSALTLVNSAQTAIDWIVSKGQV